MMNNAYKKEQLRPQPMKSSTAMLTSSSLPTLPGYVFRLNQLLSGAEADLDAVTRVIRTDASLSAQTLRLANLYRLETESPICTVAGAVASIGVARLRTMIITCPLLDCAASLEQWTRLQSFWQHNFMTAVLSEEIARFLDSERPEVAYTAGLLREMGELSLIAKCHAMGTSWPEEHSARANRVRSREAGRRLAIACKLTPELVEACSCDDPARAWHDALLVKIVTSASSFCSDNGLISGGKPQQLTGDTSQEQLADGFTELFRFGRHRAIDLVRRLTWKFRTLLPELEFNQAGLLNAALSKTMEQNQQLPSMRASA